MNYADYLSENKFYIFICPSTQRQSHTHNYLELVYVLKGSAIHNWNQTSTQIREGDFFIIDYDSLHSYKATTDSFELINCLFMPEFIDPTLKNCGSLQTVISNYQIHFKNVFFTANPSANIFRDDDGKIKTLLLAMLEEFHEQAPGYQQIIHSRIIELLVMTMRKIYLDHQSDQREGDMDRIIKYINANYMNDITLKNICRRFNYSFSYMSMKFKKTLGMTYTEYLQKIRVEQSMRLLVSTDISVDEIERVVGYRDLKAFYTVFKRFANTTPAKFRKNYYLNPQA